MTRRPFPARLNPSAVLASEPDHVTGIVITIPLRRARLASRTATVANATVLSPFILSAGAAWNVLPFDFLIGKRPIFHALEEAVLWVNRQRHIGLARD